MEGVGGGDDKCVSVLLDAIVCVTNDNVRV